MGKIILTLLIGIAGGVLLTRFFEISFTPKLTEKTAQVTPVSEPEASDTTRLDPTQTTPTIAPSITTATAKGNIDIELGYPAGGIPPLKVCLFTVPAKVGMYDKATLCETTTANQTEMTLSADPGNYHVFAWPAGADSGTFVGAWTPAVACGLSVDCSDHTPLVVKVVADQISAGVEIKDWYTDGANYPKKP